MNVNEMVPPMLLSSATSVSVSWIIKTFPRPTSFVVLPPAPIPGPPKTSFGVPRSVSPPSGMLVSKTLACPSGVNPLLFAPTAVTVMPYAPSHCSPTYSPFVIAVPSPLVSKSSRTHSKHTVGVAVGSVVGLSVSRIGAIRATGAADGRGVGTPLGASLGEELPISSIKLPVMKSPALTSMTISLSEVAKSVPSLSSTSTNPGKLS
mmetsp:Transcript_15694/g.23102  ORF Transcript_15694/g.23102 Transcript_15694/m.23102 type:complete len:206 (-) Transcript_15694:1472-2089(-)